MPFSPITIICCTEGEEKDNFLSPRLSGHEPSAVTVEISHSQSRTSDHSADFNCKCLDYFQIPNISNIPNVLYTIRRPPLRTGELRAVKDEVPAINTQR